MVREKRRKGRQDVSSSPSSDVGDEDFTVQELARGTMAVSQRQPSKARRSTSGRGITIDEGGATQRPRRSTGTRGKGKGRASPPPADEGDEVEEEVEADPISEPLLAGVRYSLQQPVRFRAPRCTMRSMTSYNVGRHNFKELREANPYIYEKEEVTTSDIRFWSQFQMDWYQTVVLTKKNPVVKMQWVDWDHMSRLEDPVLNQVIEACEAKNVYNIMGLRKNWNVELIAQFYSTLWMEGNGLDAVMHWMLQGNRFSITYRQFAAFLGFNERDLNRPKLHSKNLPDDLELDSLYDKSLGFVKYGNTVGLKPFYKYMNTLLRATLAPKVGDKTNINNISKTILVAMGPDQPPFSVFDFIWWEIVSVSQSGTKSLVYAPYIMHMLHSVTRVHFQPDTVHTSYKVQLLSAPPAPSAGPSSSSARVTLPAVEPSRRHKSSSLLFRGLKALFCICQDNAVQIREHRRETREMFQYIDESQREIRAHTGMTVPPPREFPELPPPPVFEDPWAPYRMAQDFVAGHDDFEEDIEEDEGGAEGDGDEDDE